MRLIGKSKLEKYKRKHRGNARLLKSIDDLIALIESSTEVSSHIIFKQGFKWDCVHNDGFYFVNLESHRALMLLEFESDGIASLVWFGNHKEYEKTFWNNKSTIHSWLRSHEYIG